MTLRRPFPGQQLGVPPYFRNYVRLSAVFPSGTGGGATSATTQNVRPLNTKDFDNAGLCVLASNQFTLQPGNWEITEVGSVFNPGNRCKPRLRNVTDATTVIIGVGGAFVGVSTAVTFLKGKFVITAPKTFQIEEWTQGAEATDGLGAAVSSGDSEIYTIVDLYHTPLVG